MKKISTGQDNTLENWIRLSEMAFGKTSGATKFLTDLAEKSENGIKEEVIADERQLLMVLSKLHSGNA